MIASLAQIPLTGVLALGIGRWHGLGMAGPAVVHDHGHDRRGAAAGARPVARQAGLPADAPRHPATAPAVLGHPQGRPDLLASRCSPRTSRRCGLTGLVGRFGVAVLAGYGIGVRLEFMLVPLAYRHRLGADDAGRRRCGRPGLEARRAGRLDRRLAAFGLIGAIGWIVALVPEEWSRLFTSDPKVIAATVAYITHVAPFYCLFGLGMTLAAASQGAGRMTAPFCRRHRAHGRGDGRRLVCDLRLPAHPRPAAERRAPAADRRRA